MDAESELVLDPNIRNWVLIPITITMILVGCLRNNVMQLLNTPPKPQPLKAVREQRAIARSAILRSHANHLPKADFLARKAALADGLTSGRYLKAPPVVSKSATEGESDQPQMPPNPFGDATQMDGMMDGLKKQMVMLVPQTVIMGWINFFFTGFILIKLPFPLTLRFKSMLQRGIDTTDMDVRWVSSLSWYFLNLFGLGSVYRLLLGDENAADGSRDMQAMGGLGGAAAPPGMGPQPDYAKLFASEAELLDLVDHRWINDGVEGRILRMAGYDVLE